jgi:NAD(P)-dependent dehydrogenase (short-subunit alcohol dehydrogenase family)
MGREYVRGFLKEGAKVVATDMSWSPSGASSDDIDFFEEVNDNPDVLADVMDITIDSHIKRVYAATMEKFGTVDVIINNAGMRTRDLYPPPNRVTILDTEVNDWIRLFDTHVFGTFRVIKTFVPPMLEKKSGAIINVCSGGWNGSRPDSGEGPYQPAKSAEATMAKYLSVELKPYNIAVNVLIPGHTRTTGSDEQEAARDAIAAAAGNENRYRPLRIRPDSGVPLALFLAQQDASGTTGEVVNVPRWNQDNGFGGPEVWGYEPDVEVARAAGRL